MASKLINDLTKVPNIIADLGLGIANAQKQMNSGYLDALRILVAQVASITKGLPEGPETARFVSELLMNLAPPRYQFTQTELSHRGQQGAVRRFDQARRRTGWRLAHLARAERVRQPATRRHQLPDEDVGRQADPGAECPQGQVIDEGS